MGSHPERTQCVETNVARAFLFPDVASATPLDDLHNALGRTWKSCLQKGGRAGKRALPASTERLPAGERGALEMIWFAHSSRIKACRTGVAIATAVQPWALVPRVVALAPQEGVLRSRLSRAPHACLRAAAHWRG